MFRNWYKGISQDKHLKQKRKTQRFRSMTKRVKLFCTLRSGELLFSLGSVVHQESEKVPCSFIKSISFTVTVSCTFKGQSEYRLFFEPSPFINKKTKTLALYHTVEGFSPTFSDFS